MNPVGAALSWVIDHPTLTVVLALALVLLLWILDEREDAESGGEWAGAVTKRAGRATGGLLNVAAVVFVAVVGAASDAGVHAVRWLGSFAAGDPVLAAGWASTLVGGLGFAGWLELSPLWYVAGGGLTLVLATFAASRKRRSRRRSSR